MLSKLLSSQILIYNCILFFSFSLSVNYFVDFDILNYIAYVLFHLTLVYLIFYYFNTIGIRINSRYAHALWFLAYFVPNFLLIIFLKTTKIYLVPPTLKIAKTAEKSSISSIFRNTTFLIFQGRTIIITFGLFCSKSWTYHFSQVQLGQSGPAYA